MAAGRKTANVHGCKPNHRRIEQIGPVGSLTAGLLGQAGVIFRVPPSPAFRYTSRAIWKGDRVHFGNSQLLWLTAFIVPLLGLFFWWAWRRRARLLTQFIHSKLIDQLTLGLSHGRRLAKLGLLLFITTLLMLALARPKYDSEWQVTEMRSLDILVGVDTSRSMLATDQSPNRIERAKLAVLDLMRLAKRDRLGLIAFSGTAFLQCPLTIDRNAFVQSVNSLNTDIIPQGGTALGEAINEAIRTFKKEEDNHKVLVLMTDGEDHEEGITGAIQKAKDIGMKVFTIGLGSPAGELIQVRNPQTGKLDFLKDNAGNVVKSRLNESLLRQLSTDTGAFYLPMQGADTIERLYASGLANLTPSRVENQMTKRFIEQFQWPLGLAILLLFVEMLLPEVHRPARKRTSPATATALLLLCLSMTTASASPAEARRQMDSGDFASALDTYEKLLSEADEDSPIRARLHYNAGTAAYQAGDFAKAEENFREALNIPEAPLPLQQRAFYNLGNSLFRLGEETQNPDEKIKQWTGALKQFEGANNMSRQLEGAIEDEDALFNSDIVKKRLEQLNQQQQQQQNQDGEQNEDEEQKDDQQQQQQNQQNSDEQQKNEQQQNQEQSEDQKEQQQQQNQNSDDEEQKEQEQNQQQSGDDDEQQKEQQQQSGSQGEEEKEQPQQGQSQEQSDSGQAQQEGKMTQEQVRQLLDSLKQQERSLIYRPIQKGKTKRPGTFRDW